MNSCLNSIFLFNILKVFRIHHYFSNRLTFVRFHEQRVIILFNRLAAVIFELNRWGYANRRLGLQDGIFLYCIIFFWITLIIHTNCVITILKALFLTTETKKSTFYLESSYMYCYNVCSPSYRLNTQKTWLKTTITVARVIFISENFDKYLMPFLRIEIVKKLYFIMTIF